MKLKSILEVAFSHLRKSGNFQLLLSALALVMVLTLSMTKVFAADTDIEVWKINRNDQTYHCYMTYATEYPAASNLYNNTQPAFNLYELPFTFGITRTQTDGSAPTDSASSFIYGYVFKKISITFDKTITPEILEIVSSDTSHVYIELSSLSNKTLTLSVFFDFDNLAVNRITDIGQFTLLARYTTNALDDKLKITAITTSDFVGSVNVTNTPSTQGSAVENIVRAINAAGDIDTVISILNAIKSNTDLYTQVLAAIQSIGSDVADIKQYLASGTAGAALDDVANSQSAALSDYLSADASLQALDPAGPPSAAALGVQISNFTDSIQNSIYFWSYELRDFFDSIGIIWVLLIVGLVIGLTGFLLRLRR